MQAAGQETGEAMLKLYIAGKDARSERAIATLAELSRNGLRFATTIIDVLENPDVAEVDKVIATPMLARIAPPPVRRVVGDLSDKDRVRQTLQLDTFDSKEG